MTAYYCRDHYLYSRGQTTCKIRDSKSEESKLCFSCRITQWCLRLGTLCRGSWSHVLSAPEITVPLCHHRMLQMTTIHNCCGVSSMMPHGCTPHRITVLHQVHTMVEWYFVTAVLKKKICLAFNRENVKTDFCRQSFNHIEPFNCWQEQKTDQWDVKQT